jgi:hypothetical protein
MKTLLLPAIVLAFLSVTSARAQAPVQPPSCMIDQLYGNFHMGTSAAGDTVAIIWCDDQSGLRYWGIAGNTSGAVAPPCLVSAGRPSWSLAYLQAVWSACTATAGPLNADQQAEANVLIQAWLPRLAVTGPANQNVYTANADGTRGPQLVVAGIGMQVAPTASCDGSRLLNASARFADVSGRQSTNGVTLPAGSFALCSITYPPSTGFAN